MCLLYQILEAVQTLGYASWCVEYEFSEVRPTSILGSSVIVALFATVSADAPVGGMGKGGGAMRRFIKVLSVVLGMSVMSH